MLEEEPVGVLVVLLLGLAKVGSVHRFLGGSAPLGQWAGAQQAGRLGSVTYARVSRSGSVAGKLVVRLWGRTRYISVHGPSRWRITSPMHGMPQIP